MGPYQRTPKEVARAIRYSGLGVRSVGPVGDFLECVVKFSVHDSTMPFWIGRYRGHVQIDFFFVVYVQVCGCFYIPSLGNTS